MKELTGEHTLKLIKPRKEDSNKYDFGCLTMLCGSPWMTGAAALAANGALRSGLGLLRVSGNEETLLKLQNLLLEPVFINIENIFEAKCDAFLCGCGIGRIYDRILPELLESCKVKAILDADCINFIAAHIDILGRMNCEKLITPHPAEMARLCQKSVDEIQSDRIGSAVGFAQEHNVITVLKGRGTVIAAPDGRVCVNQSGSSALAKGGSGDVLAGVIASLAAQGYELYDAARIGVYVHGLAADRLEKTLGKCGLIPSDLPKEIGRILG